MTKGRLLKARLMMPSHQKPTELIRAGSRARHRRLGEGRLEVRGADEKQGSEG